MTSDSWDGIDRRARPALTDAVAEMRGLKESVIQLAQTVGQTMTKDELTAISRRTRLIIAADLLSTLILVILMVTTLACR